MHNLTPSGFFTDPVPTLDDGDPVAASSTTPTSQALCDRTAYTQALLALAQGFSATTTAGGTTTLTAASNERQYFSGSANQNIVLPDETTVPSGKFFFIFQNSTGTLTIKNHDGSTLLTVPPKNMTSRYELVLLVSASNSIANGNWKYFAEVPGQLQGTNTNDDAASGNVGEIISSSVVSGSAVVLASTVAANITSIVVPGPGDFRIHSCVGFAASGATDALPFLNASRSKTSATLSNSASTDAVPVNGEVVCRFGFSSSNETSTSASYTMNMPSDRFTLTSPTTFYLVAQSTFAFPFMSAWGRIWAERAR